MYKINMEDSKIITKVEQLRNAKLIEGCHLYNRYKEFPNITIGEAVTKEVKEKEFGRNVSHRPAIALLEVIFSIHTNYAKFVEPAICKMMEKYELQGFDDIKKKVNELSKTEFLIYWDYNYEDKYEILLNMLKGIDELRTKYKEIKTDYELLHEWAKHVEITNIKDDTFGRIHGVAEATVQHLRMNFGVDTTKPDQHVVGILEHEFKTKTNKIKAIKYMERLALITNYKVIELDQIFVNYGSGYYETHKGNVKQRKAMNENNIYMNSGKKCHKSRFLAKFEISIEIGKKYSYLEFNKHIKENIDLDSQLFELLKLFFEEIINKDLVNDTSLRFKRRGDKNKPSYIYEFDERKGNMGKNVFTLWLQIDGIRIHIPSYLNVPNGKLYTEIEEMRKDKINYLLNERYAKMTERAI